MLTKSPRTFSFEEEIIKFQASGLDIGLNLKLDQLQIIDELNTCLGALFEVSQEEIQLLVSISLFEYQRDTGLDLSYLANALPQERVVHVGKILYRLQNTLKSKIKHEEELKQVEEKIERLFKSYIKIYATR